MNSEEVLPLRRFYAIIHIKVGDGMDKSIIEGINQLFRSQLINALLYLALIIVCVLVVIGVIKFKLLNSKAKKIALSLTVAICSIGLIIIQIITIAPVYKDYKQQSYIIVEDATMMIKDGSTGGINPTNSVVVSVGGNTIELKMQTNYTLDTNTEYVGTVAYSKHSQYVVWYSFNK